MKPAFQQSPAKSFRTFIAEGGRDPHADPREGDVVGYHSPRVDHEWTVGVVNGELIPVSKLVCSKDRDGRGRCGRVSLHVVTLEQWRRALADAQVFIVAADPENC